MDIFDTVRTAPVAADDSIMVKGQRASAGSKILGDFVAPFDATVVTRLRERGIAISSGRGMSEFGLYDLFADGSGDIGGAVAAVVEGEASFALSNDVFGGDRFHAARNGLCYIAPAYGTVSRYGLIPLVSSMDRAGIVCRDLSAGFDLLSSIAGNDPKDGAMYAEKNYVYARVPEPPRVGVPAGIIEKTHGASKDALLDFAAAFENKIVDLPYFDIYAEVMYILCSAELSANISRYDGIKFGYRAEGFENLEELYLRTRTEGFGLQAKLAAVMGSLVLSKGMYASYYEKAMKIRRLIKESLSFDDCDVILLPASAGEDPLANFALFALASLAGLPSVVFPYGGGAVQLIAGAGNENALLTAREVTK